MKVSGLKICKKEMVKNIGLIMLFMKGNTEKGKRMGLEHSVGAMELNIVANL